MSTSPGKEQQSSPSKAKQSSSALPQLLALPAQLSDQLRGSLKSLGDNLNDSLERGKLPGGIEIKCVGRLWLLLRVLARVTEG